jgi:uncharacterized RDD family membrane protein YckC
VNATSRATAAQGTGAHRKPYGGHAAPPLARRLACMVYEGVLLFGVLMTFGLIYSALTQQRHAMEGRHGLQAWVFLVLAAYFAGFWADGRQTLAMKTWHVRVETEAGEPVTLLRAVARYVLSWLWFAPALTLAWLGDWQGMSVVAALVVGSAAYAGLAWLRSDRQFLHDVVCGTRLVDARRGTGT